MRTCLKCGYDGNRGEYTACEKCGAVQDKVRAFITEKISAGLAACDELTSRCESEERRTLDLKAFAEKNKRVNVDWQTTCLDQLCEIDANLAKLKGQVGQLKGHASAFSVDYETNHKLSKLRGYLEKCREEIEQLSAKLDDLWTAARYATLNHAAGASAGFEAPTGNAEKFKVLEEVETRIYENRYPSMLIIAGIYKAIGWLTAILTLVVVAIGLYSLAEGGIAVALGGLLIGPIICISLFAFAESIKVGIDIEQNTRAAREYARGLFMKEMSGK